MRKLFEIQQVIMSDFNREPFYPRLAYHHITLDNQVTGLVGPRGVGKTTFLLHQVQRWNATEKQALYVSADNIYFLENKLIDLVDQLYKETNVTLLCVDEIQKYPNWEQELKNISDTYRHFKILFTGSSMIELVNAKFDLSRRVTLHHLHGLSFREYLGFYHNIELPVLMLDDIVKKHERIVDDLSMPDALKYFNHYLQCGYYPFFKRFTQERDKYQAVENTTQKIIYEDIAILHALKTPTLALIEMLYKYVINSVPGELSAYKISRLLGKDFASISVYLNYLQQAGLIRFLFPKKSGKAYLRNPEKLYPDNTNLIYASYLPLHQDSAIGKIRETFVINQIQNAGIPIYYPEAGDFRVGEYLIEVGGRNKTSAQINHEKNAFVFADGILVGHRQIIPLYLLGMLY